MYYLWKDKKSTKKHVLVFITDYKEIRNDGKIKVDHVGWIDAELVFSHEKKYKCVEYAQEMIFRNREIN
jgi:hypothetical protein